jgi:hypothetical protein
MVLCTTDAFTSSCSLNFPHTFPANNWICADRVIIDWQSFSVSDQMHHCKLFAGWDRGWCRAAIGDSELDKSQRDGAQHTPNPVSSQATPFLILLHSHHSTLIWCVSTPTLCSIWIFMCSWAVHDHSAVIRLGSRIGTAKHKETSSSYNHKKK